MSITDMAATGLTRTEASGSFPVKYISQIHFSSPCKQCFEELMLPATSMMCSFPTQHTLSHSNQGGNVCTMPCTVPDVPFYNYNHTRIGGSQERTVHGLEPCLRGLPVALWGLGDLGLGFHARKLTGCAGHLCCCCCSC